MGFVSPVSLMLLLAYGSVLEGKGPRAALRISTLACGSVLGSAAAALQYMETKGLHVTALPYVRAVVGALFVFRESYVQLLTSQHWSFMGSVLTPNQSSQWFAPISGLTSTTSALAGMAVSGIVERVGLTGTLGAAGLILVLSAIMAESAYGISERYGFNPADEHVQGRGNKGKGEKQKGALYMFKQASDLFKRVPVLGALFLEILACQGLSTILNVCYVSKLSQTITDDRERAGWSGKFFAYINVASGTLQFLVLPPLMRFIEPSTLWRAMPIMLMAFTSYLGASPDPSLFHIAGTFLVMKATEFSARRMLDELVYVPLDFDSRYVGKGVIGVLGYRFGKSVMSLSLSALTNGVGGFGGIGFKELTWMTTAAAAVWGRATWSLSNKVLTRAEAEEAYERKRVMASAMSKGGDKRSSK